MYAYNGDFGIETCSEKSDAEYHQDNPVEVHAEIATMFPGTFEEWNRHIDNCIIAKLKKLGMTCTNQYGTYIK